MKQASRYIRSLPKTPNRVKGTAFPTLNLARLEAKRLAKALGVPVAVLRLGGSFICRPIPNISAPGIIFHGRRGNIEVIDESGRSHSLRSERVKSKIYTKRKAILINEEGPLFKSTDLDRYKSDKSAVLARVENWSKNKEEAYDWYKNHKLQGFGGLTPFMLVRRGLTSALMEHLDRIEIGGHV